MRYLTLNLLFLLAGSASGQNFTFVGCNEFDLSWTNSNGKDRVVFVREDSAIDKMPVHNEYYTENPVFGKGESIKGDTTHFCVYRGPGSSVKVRGLKNLSKYYVAIYEYDGGAGIYNYDTINYLTKNTITKNIIANGYLYYSSDKNTKLGDGGQCLYGNNFQFRNKSTSDITPMSYSWNFGDGDISTDKEPKHTYKTIGINQVTLMAQAKGCYSSITFNDTVYPHPVAKFDFEPNDTTQCWYGNIFTFKNKSTLTDIGIGFSSMRFDWYEVPYTIPFSTRYNADAKFKSDGKKTVKLVVISNGGCRDSTFRSGFTVRPGIIDPSKISISPDSMPLKNNKFTFTNTSTKTWQLRSKNNPSFKDSIRGSSVNYSFKSVGWYYISFDTMDTKSGCYEKYTDSIEVKQDIGIFKHNSISNISIYPNPSKTGVFHISDLPADASIIVSSIIGKELINFNPRQKNSEINLSQFREGTYILTLSSEGKKFVYKLIVL